MSESKRASEREKDTEKEVSVSSPDNENKTGCMPSSGPWPKHISLAWASYKQGNEKHMLEGKVRSEGLWVNDSRPKTFSLFFSCGLVVSDVIWPALISHGGGLPCASSLSSFSFLPPPFLFLLLLPGTFFGWWWWWLKDNRQRRMCVIFFSVLGKRQSRFP